MGMPDCIRLEVGEPNFTTAPHIIEAAHHAALEGHTRYTDNSGIFELRAAIAEQAEESTSEGETWLSSGGDEEGTAKT